MYKLIVKVDQLVLIRTKDFVDLLIFVHVKVVVQMLVRIDLGAIAELDCPNANSSFFFPLPSSRQRLLAEDPLSRPSTDECQTDQRGRRPGVGADADSDHRSARTGDMSNLASMSCPWLTVRTMTVTRMSIGCVVVVQLDAGCLVNVWIDLDFDPLQAAACHGV